MSTSRITSMEGLRGVAVGLVFLVHFATAAFQYAPESSFSYSLLVAMHSAGNVGVDLFFVISGFLIYPLVLQADFRFVPFFARRVRRIYPTFLAVLSAYLLLSLIFGSHSKLPDAAAAVAIYITQNLLLLPGIFPIEPIVTVAWSLSYEMAFYLLLPLLLLIVPLRQLDYRSRLVFWSVLAFLGFSITLVCGGPVRIMMFIAGMLVSDVMFSSSARLPPNLGGGLMLAGGVGLLLYPEFDLPNAYKYPVLFVVIGLFCWDCFVERSATARLMAWAPLRWLGNRSYSYYLIHGLTLQAAFLGLAYLLPALPKTAWLPWLLIVPMFFVTLIPAWLLFEWVEKPLSLRDGHSR